MTRNKATLGLLIGAGAAIMAASFVSCGSDDSGGGGNTTNVGVVLREFNIALTQSSAPAGRVKFQVANLGDDMHEFLVIKTDLAPDALPTEANGSYLEDGPGTDLLEEIEDVEPGDTSELEIDLDEGHYVLICNMVHTEDNGEVEIHYQLGMRTAFTVD